MIDLKIYKGLKCRELLNICWQEAKTQFQRQLYGALPTVSSKVAYRRMKLVAHCIGHPKEIASKFVLWQAAVG